MAGPCGICTRFPILLLQTAAGTRNSNQRTDAQPDYNCFAGIVKRSLCCHELLLQKDSGVAGLQKHHASADLYARRNAPLTLKI